MKHTNLLEIHDLQTFIFETLLEKPLPVHFNTFVVIWVQEGDGKLLIDNKNNAITNNTVYCISWGQVLFFEELNCIKGYALQFNSTFLDPLKSNSMFLPNTCLFNNNSITSIKLSIETKKEIELLIGSMIKENTNVSKLNIEILRSFLMLFLIHLAREKDTFPNELINNDRNIASQFLELVQTHFITIKKVAEYAEKLFISPNYLNITVKKVTGFTASYHVQQRIVLEAKRLASYNQMSMKEICSLLGYDDLSHFSKFFKNYTGTSFSNLKKT